MLKRLFPVLAVLLFLASALFAQTASPKVAQIFVSRPKPGSELALEQGRIKHMAWHRSQKDPWTWYTWQIMTGESMGSYVTGTFGHDWKDFDGRDQFQAADTKDVALNMGPYQASSLSAFYVVRPDMNVSPPDMNAPPAPYVNVIHFMLKPEGLNDFTQNAKKIGEGVQKAGVSAPRSTWYQLVNGGHGPEFVLVQDRKSFADFHTTDKSLDQLMQEAYGDDGAATLKTFRQSYHGTYTELLHYRPDLSYIPAAK